MEILEDRTLLATFVIDDDGLGNFTSIQAAIDNLGTMDGDVLQITGGADRIHTESGIAVTKDLRIEGTDGANQVIVQAHAFAGMATDRVFLIPSETVVTIDNLTIQHGVRPDIDLPDAGEEFDAESGAGIYNAGTLTITNSTITANSARHYGGGIYNVKGTLNLTNIEVSNNTANSSGGGIANEGGFSSSAILHISDSRIIGNTARGLLYGGGGIYSDNGDVMVIASTISGNRALVGEGAGIDTEFSSFTIIDSLISDNSTPAEGGGISNTFSDLTVINSTITGNSSGRIGGGIHIAFESSGDFRTTSVTNSTILGNTANLGGGIFNIDTRSDKNVLDNTIVGGSLGGDLVGLYSGTNNLIQDGSGIGLANTIEGDPLLGPLQDNGGPTLTYSPLFGSPAINGGEDAFAVDENGLSLQTDQRGRDRFIGTVDIGAVETTITAVSVLADQSSQEEGSDGPTHFTFTVTLVGNPTGTTSVDYAVIGSDVEPEDFVGGMFPTGTVVFNPGETEKTIMVAVNGDSQVETVETFGVMLLNPPVNVLVDPAPAESMILNDDTATLTLVGTNAIQLEGSGPGRTAFTFSVMLDHAVDGGLNVGFTTNDGTATTDDNDYLDNDGRLAFVGSAGEVQTIAVQVNHDLKVESNEFFSIVLASIGGLRTGIDSGNVIIGNGTQEGTIQNDDVATLILAGVNSSQLEGTGQGLFTDFIFSVTLDNPVAGSFDLEYFTNDGPINLDPDLGIAIAGDDYEDNDGVLTFNGDAERQQIVVRVNADAKVEATELFHVVLGAITNLSGGIDASSVKLSESINDRQQVGTILNNTPDGETDDTSNLTIEFDSFVTGPNGEPRARFSIMSSNPVQGGFRVAVLTETGGDSGVQFVGANLANEAGFADFAEGEPIRMVDIPLPADPNVVVLLGGVNPFGPGVRSEDIRTGASVPLPLREKEIVVFAAGPGGGPHIRVFDTRTNSSRFEFFAYDVTFSGGVRVAKGDLNQDGVSEIITAPGPGGGPHIKVFDGTDPNKILFSFFAYGAAFTGGVFVAAGDITGDGRADIITGADAGGGPNVKVFDGETGAEIRNFFAYGAAFSGGVRVAAGDVNGDQQADIVTSPGAGGGPHIKVFDGATSEEIRSFFAYEPNFTGGVFVAAGDVNGDQQADIITGAGPGREAQVKVFDGNTSAEIRQFFPYGAAFTGGVFVAAGDVNGDGRADIVTGAGPGGGPHVKVFDGTTLAELKGYFAYSPLFTGGVYVAGLFPLPTSSASAQRFVSSESPSSKGLTLPTNHTSPSSSALRLQGDLLSAAPSDSLTLTQVSPLLDEAIYRVEKVYPSLNVLRDHVSVQIDDLDGDQLGTAIGTTIVLDANAAGRGWFIDPTPADDVEFQTADRDIPSQVDLLTVISHELGHIVGLQHEDDPAHLMAERLPTGIRRTLNEEDSAAMDFAFREWTMDALG